MRTSNNDIWILAIIVYLLLVVPAFAELGAEQDRIKRAQLENEQCWNDLARKAQATQNQWRIIDDSLSLRQAVTEVNDLKREIANLKSRLDFQFQDNKRNLKKAYDQQIAITKPMLPPNPAPKDAFEKTDDYNMRLADYDIKVKEANRLKDDIISKLRAKENLEVVQSEVVYLWQQIRLLEPFINRLMALQNKVFLLHDERIIVELGEPDADKNCFPLYIRHKANKWTEYWNYTDSNQARDFYKTRSLIMADGLFQLEDGTSGVNHKLVSVRVSHPETGDKRELYLNKLTKFFDIEDFEKITRNYEISKTKRKKARKLLRDLVVIDESHTKTADGVTLNVALIINDELKNYTKEISVQCVDTLADSQRNQEYSRKYINDVKISLGTDVKEIFLNGYKSLLGRTDVYNNISDISNKSIYDLILIPDVKVKLGYDEEQAQNLYWDISSSHGRRQNVNEYSIESVVELQVQIMNTDLSIDDEFDASEKIVGKSRVCNNRPNLLYSAERTINNEYENIVKQALNNAVSQLFKQTVGLFTSVMQKKKSTSYIPSSL